MDARSKHALTHRQRISDKIKFCNVPFRYSSRRARTLESLSSLYVEEDVMKNLEESARLQVTIVYYLSSSKDFAQAIVNYSCRDCKRRLYVNRRGVRKLTERT